MCVRGLKAGAGGNRRVCAMQLTPHRHSSSAQLYLISTFMHWHRPGAPRYMPLVEVRRVCAELWLSSADWTAAMKHIRAIPGILAASKIGGGEEVEERGQNYVD